MTTIKSEALFFEFCVVIYKNEWAGCFQLSVQHSNDRFHQTAIRDSTPQGTYTSLTVSTNISRLTRKISLYQKECNNDAFTEISAKKM
jgi:hypothetical protein